MQNHAKNRIAAAAAVTGLLVGTVMLVAADPRERGLLVNSLLLAGGVAIIAVPLGTLLAWLLLRTNAAGRRTAAVVLITLLFVPLFLQAAAWDAGLGRQGWLSLAQGNLATPVLESWRAAIWIQAAALVPWVVLIVGLGLAYIEPELEETALLDMSAWQVVWRVALRQAAASVVVAVLWVGVVAVGEMTVTDLYQIRSFAEELYRNVPSFGELAAGEGDLTGLVAAAAVAVLALAGLTAAALLTPPDRAPHVRASLTYRLKSWRWPLSITAVGIVVLLAGVPLGNLLINAGMSVEPVDGKLVRFWSAGKCVAMVLRSPYEFRRELGWSFLMGSLVAVIAVSLAIVLASLSRRSFGATCVAWFTAAVCLAIPGPLIGLGLIWLLNRESAPLLVWLYDRSILAPVLAMLVRAWPIVMLICWYAWRSLSQDVFDAAASEGASGWARLWHIAIPQRRAALAVAGIAGLAIAVGDLSATILVTPPGLFIVSTRVFGLLHAGVDDQLAGLCLTLVLIFLLLAMVALAVVRMSARRKVPR